jgi:exodeoxyribonuclease VII large subunit
LSSPAATIAHERLKLQSLQARLLHATRIPLTQARHALLNLRTRLAAQIPDTIAPRIALLEQSRRLNGAMAAQNRNRRQTVAALNAQLELLNPQRTLERGYAIISDAKGHVIRSPQVLKPRHVVTVQLAEGSAKVGIDSVQATLD